MKTPNETLLTVDHVGLLGPRIEAMVADCKKLGFGVIGPVDLLGEAAGGQTVDLGQKSAHIMFAKDYIELTSVQSELPEHHLARFLGNPWGLRLLLIKTQNIDEAWEQAARSGLDPQPVQSASRRVVNGPETSAYFRWFGLSATHFPDALVCYVEHQTPELVFANPPTHANGAIGLARLSYVGDRLPASLIKLRSGSGGIVLDVVSAENFRRLFGLEAKSLTPLGIVELTTRDLSQTRDVFEANAVEFTEQAGAIRTFACNTVFIFSEVDPAAR